MRRKRGRSGAGGASKEEEAGSSGDVSDAGAAALYAAFPGDGRDGYQYRYRAWNLYYEVQP